MAYIHRDDKDEEADEIILVSSTRQKWEKLHGIHRGNKNSRSNDNGDNKNVGADTDDEDEVLVVAVKPTQPKHRLEQDPNIRRASIYSQIKRRFFELAGGNNCTSVFIEGPISSPLHICMFVFTIGLWVGMRKLRRKSRMKSITKEKIDENGIKVDKTTENSTSDKTDRETLIRVVEGVNANADRNTEGVPQSPRDTDLSREVSGLSSPIISTSSSITQRTREGGDTSVTLQNQREAEKRKMARQFVQDIRLVRDVLVEHELDPSMASQLAMTLQSSQQIIESQRDLCYQKAMLDAHQRHLDRQLSERQHQESLQGQKYDPNWREKLHAMRDQCYYWNLSNGGVGRLWWEILLIQQLARGVMPVWRYYYYSEFHRWNDKGILGMENENTDKLSRLVASLLKDTIASVATQVCNCQSTNVPGTMQSTTASWTILITASSAFSATNGIFAGLVEYWSCYGYCLLHACTLLVLTMILHQGLRILSVPSAVHHAVNLVSMTLFHGIQRTFTLVITTIMRMLMILPNTTRTGLENEHDDSSTSSSMIGCSLLLLSLWILFPLVSWIRTPYLCRQLEVFVTQADPVDFESTLHGARARLQRWHLEQITLRYLFLSVYSALVLWENSQGTMIF